MLTYFRNPDMEPEKSHMLHSLFYSLFIFLQHFFFFSLSFFQVLTLGKFEFNLKFRQIRLKQNKVCHFARQAYRNERKWFRNYPERLSWLAVLIFFSCKKRNPPVSQPLEVWFLFLVKDEQRQVGDREAALLCGDSMHSQSFLECLLWNSFYKKSREWPPQMRGSPQP